MTDILLTTAEVAERLAVHPNTVKNLAARGFLPVVKLGKSVRFRSDDVDDAIAKAASASLTHATTTSAEADE